MMYFYFAALIPALTASWWIIPAISGGISALTFALNYLLRPKQADIRANSSPTYSFDGMRNSYEPGTPINVAYGMVAVPPAILNWYRSGWQGTSWALFVGSLGYGTIGGVRKIYLNNLPIEQFYSDIGETVGEFYGTNTKCDITISHGEYVPKYYRWGKYSKGKITAIGSDTLEVTCTGSKRNFQAASSGKPGYLFINKSSTDEDGEMVRYLGMSRVGDTVTFTGVRKTKTHHVNDTVVQFYKIIEDADGRICDHSPAVSLTAVSHTDMNNIELSSSDWTTVTPVGGSDKLENFSITFGAPNGIYKLTKTGYEKLKVNVEVRWRPVGGSYDATIGQVLVENTSAPVYYIKVEKNTNYAILVDVNGNEIQEARTLYDSEGGVVESAFTGLTLKSGVEMIQFEATKMENGVSVTKNFRYTIKSVIKEAVRISEDTEDCKYRLKILFGKRVSSGDGSSSTDLEELDSSLHKGSSVASATYKIYWWKNQYSNATVSIPEKEAVSLSDLQLTYNFPVDTEWSVGKLAYGKYDVQVRLKAGTPTNNTQKNATKVVLTSFEAYTVDDLSYPGEATISMKMRMTDKISGMIDNVQVEVDGKLVKNVTESLSSINQWTPSTVYSMGDRVKPIVGGANDCRHVYRVVGVQRTDMGEVTSATSGSIEPAWQPIAGCIVRDSQVNISTLIWEEDSCKWSDNPVDILCDIQMNRIYGRGLYNGYDFSTIRDLYDSYGTGTVPIRDYCSYGVAENNKTRPRINMGVNIDYIQPVSDTLEALSKGTRIHSWWDGTKFLSYIDKVENTERLINNACVIDGTLEIADVDLSEKINRIYGSFVNKKRKWVQDQVGRDFVDEGFSSDLLTSESYLFTGITDKWHMVKILKYLLRHAKYVQQVISFEMSVDACIHEIGSLFYFSHEDVNMSSQTGSYLPPEDVGYKKWYGISGRVISSSLTNSSITVDKDVSVSSGQKLYVRMGDGTVEKWTISSLIGTREIVVSPGNGSIQGLSISAVSANCIYTFGTESATETPVRKFRVVEKTSLGSGKYRIVGMTYDSRVFDGIYKGSQDSSDIGTDPNHEDDNTPLNVINKRESIPYSCSSLVIKEDKNIEGDVLVGYTPPKGGIWDGVELYVSKVDTEDMLFGGRSSGRTLRVSGLEPGTIYDFFLYSVSGSKKSFPLHRMYEYGEGLDLPTPTGLQAINRNGGSDQIYGKKFKLRWDEMSSKIESNMGTSSRGKGKGDLKYYIEIKFPTLPSPVNGEIARYDTISTTKYSYSYEDAIEDAKTLWSSYLSHPSYSTYYGKPVRTIEVSLYTINSSGQKSKATTARFTNPAPEMLDSSGSPLTITLKPLKSGMRVKWTHPYDSRGVICNDISHFIVKYATNVGMTANVKRVKVASLVTADSTDEELSSARYKEDIDGLDPKKTYYFTVRPDDVWGQGTSSSVFSASPGIVRDDEGDIASPAQAATPTLTPVNNNNITIKWASPSDNDVKMVEVEWRSAQMTGVVTLTLTSSGGSIPTSAEVAQGYLNSDNTKLVQGEDKAVVNRVDDPTTVNIYSIKNAKTGTIYFSRVRYVNTSGIAGAWSSWAYNNVAVTGSSSEDMNYQYKKFIVRKLVAGNPTDDAVFSPSSWQTLSWGTCRITFKGENTSYDIAAGSATVTAGGEIKYIVWLPTSPTIFTAISAAQLVTSAYQEAVSVSFMRGATSTLEKAFHISLSDQKEAVINSSILAANSVIAAHIQSAAITSEKIEATAIDGKTITGAVVQNSTSSTDYIKFDSSSFRIRSSNITRIDLSSTGWIGRNGLGNQTSYIGTDGSGWMGNSSHFSWDTNGNVSLDGARITNSSINGSDKFINSSIPAGKLSITTLSAIAADLGTVTAGTLQIGTLAANGDTRLTITGDGHTNQNLIKIEANAAGVTTTVCTLGLLVDGSSFISDFGNIDSGNSKVALRARSYSGTGIVAVSTSNNAINGTNSTAGVPAISGSNSVSGGIGLYGSAQSSGTGVYGSGAGSSAIGVYGLNNNSSGYGGYFENTSSGVGLYAISSSGKSLEVSGNATYLPLTLKARSYATAPSTLELGSIGYDSNANVFIGVISVGGTPTLKAFTMA